MHPRQTLASLALLTAAGLAACGDGGPPKDGVPEATTPATSTPAAPDPVNPASATPTSPAAPASPTASATGKERAKATTTRGIDASHHQGAIDWARVASHGVTFAYLKATEGTGFTDPRFAAHRAAARRHGIDVGGYHYFQLCSDGAAQARHLVEVLGERTGGLPPAVDLELAGSCPAPPRAELLAQVRAFLDVVEQQYDVRPVVYLYPELEERFGLAADLAAYPQWVRRLGKQPPDRPWRLWQYDDRGSVPGIAGGVDLNLMRTAP